MAVKSSKLHIPFWGYFCSWVQMLKNEVSIEGRNSLEKFPLNL